ncbi:hypothetical protein [Robbsia sp. KACC 23696]|uniref:hypothetical protein n=1 Tax=Robbsia sp. KACC 23696 TaxID=3149231 RepID=UPI00325AF58C
MASPDTAFRTPFDRMIASLHAGRDARHAFKDRCRQEVDALARAVESRLGAPDGAIHVLDRNGVTGDDAVIASEENPGRIQFTLSMPIEHDLELLADPRIAVERVPHQGQVSIDIGGNLVLAECLTDPRCVDAVCAAMERSVSVEAEKWQPATIGGPDPAQCLNASAEEATAASDAEASRKRSPAATLLRAAMPSLLQR